MERITLRIPQSYANKIDELVVKGIYPSISELIREAVVSEFYKKLPTIQKKMQNLQK
jgi:Arc/MetJ-type ribon-helix-helix transcriptional regulator